MAPKGEWILLSTAVVRMAELSPIYRSYPGLARRDLEKAILADRVELRGYPIGARAGSPVAVPRPLSPRHEVNLHHNTILLRRPGPSGAGLLFRDVEIEWAEAAKYLRRFVPESPVVGAIATATNATDLASNTVEVGGKRARGPLPKKRKAIVEAMEAGIREGKWTLERLRKMPEKQMEETFRASRDTCRRAKKEFESKFVGD
jgi:hypothetical protein